MCTNRGMAEDGGKKGCRGRSSLSKSFQFAPAAPGGLLPSPRPARFLLPSTPPPNRSYPFLRAQTVPTRPHPIPHTPAPPPAVPSHIGGEASAASSSRKEESSPRMRGHRRTTQSSDAARSTPSVFSCVYRTRRNYHPIDRPSQSSTSPPSAVDPRAPRHLAVALLPAVSLELNPR